MAEPGLSRPETALEVPLAGLSWLGRQGTRAVAALVVIGISLIELTRCPLQQERAVLA